MDDRRFEIRSQTIGGKIVGTVVQLSGAEAAARDAAARATTARMTALVVTAVVAGLLLAVATLAILRSDEVAPGSTEWFQVVGSARR